MSVEQQLQTVSEVQMSPTSEVKRGCPCELSSSRVEVIAELS